MKKIVLFLAIIMLSAMPSFAGSIDSVIKKSPVSKNATVSVSVRNLKFGNVVYEKDSKKLLNPASTLKAFTTPVIVSQLGDDYEFSTQLYKVGKDTVYLKLAGDPSLTSRELRHLVRELRNVGIKQPQKFYIDDTIMDSQEYGIGWQWDDESSYFIPKFSSYNIENNTFLLKVAPSADKKSVKVVKPFGYNVTVVNNLKVGPKNKVFVARNFWEGAEKVVLSGTVSSETTVKIPAYSAKRYFMSILKSNMDDANIRYYGVFESQRTPTDAVLVREYKSGVNDMYAAIMKDSNNLYSETLFKLAGGKYKKAQGKTSYGVEAFNDYYKKIGVDTSDVVIVDASGVSRNDLLSTDWMSDALVKINKKDEKFDYKTRFNLPNEGTMVNRLFDLRDYLWAKTGTLANTSGLTGYVTTKKGNEYSFAILIQNTNLPVEEAKKLEDAIVTEIYNKY